MSLQSPENDDTPATSEAAKVASKKRKWLMALSIILGILGFLVLSAPVVVRGQKAPNQSEAFNNARQLGLALNEFTTDYGRFPDETTVALVKAKHPTDLHLGTKSSNDFFRQLIASGMISSEIVFYAKVKGIIKPDNIITAGEALKKGECGFTYLSGQTVRGNPSRPLVVTPLIPGTDRFDPKPFNGKALILRMDNSVLSLPIREDGHVWTDGMNLLDPSHPIWAGKPPVIAWPE